ncbi:hypothetical protein ACIGXI_22965 [Kitasatospora aureofaciens]|uniref:hypothetical protein n=1 Tax=Kitasatospora aureofaciens TaxID=1894 RepID=UPI0037C6E4D5
MSSKTPAPAAAAAVTPVPGNDWDVAVNAEPRKDAARVSVLARGKTLPCAGGRDASQVQGDEVTAGTRTSSTWTAVTVDGRTGYVPNACVDFA